MPAGNPADYRQIRRALASQFDTLAGGSLPFPGVRQSDNASEAQIIPSKNLRD